MKKRLCCFLFLLLYLFGFLIGVLASGWLYPGNTGDSGWQQEKKDSGKISPQTLETWQAGGVTLAQEETTLAEPGKKYPGNVWGRKLGWCYLLYFVLTVAILEVGKKPLPLLAFWLLYGITSGIYARGLASFYGRLGEYYSFTAVLVIPSVLAVLTGIFWIKPGLEPGLSYVPYQKRIRDFLLVLRIRLLPSCFYAAALLLCYVTDYEIVKRIQWRLLLRMLRNVVN